jgi:hypothetical protein
MISIMALVLVTRVVCPANCRLYGSWPQTRFWEVLPCPQVATNRSVNTTALARTYQGIVGVWGISQRVSAVISDCSPTGRCMPYAASCAGP